jgi:hypothetical protein
LSARNQLILRFEDRDKRELVNEWQCFHQIAIISRSTSLAEKHLRCWSVDSPGPVMNDFCKDEVQQTEHLSGVSMLLSGGFGDKKKSFLTDVIIQSSDALDKDLEDLV